MLRDKSLTEFNAALASATAVPGGGGVSALAAALGAGLGIMVGSLTVGKKKYADTEPEMKTLMQEASAIQRRLLELIDEDAEAFEPLSKAYALPKDAPDRDKVMSVCLASAAAVPMEIVKLSCKAIDLMERFAAIGSTLAISDAGCGAALCRAALEAAALNVFVNTRLMKDRTYAEKLNKDVDICLSKYAASAEDVYDDVRRRLI